MAQGRFSEGLPDLEADVTNVYLASSISNLKALVPEQELTLKKWDDEHVAISVVLDIALPQFGCVDGIAINDQEPVLLVFDLANYPYRAPKVYIDGLDFPKNKVGHLYIAVKGKPPGLCLVRGNLDEWYATRQIDGLVARIRNWFSDAATGELNENGNEFEPLRLEGYVGSLIYDYNQLYAIANSKRSFTPADDWAKLLFERVASNGEGLTWRFIEEVTPDNLKEKLEEILAETEKDENSPEKRNLYFGYMVWPIDETTVDDYDVELPGTWEEFKTFCNKYLIPVDQFERELVNSKNLRAFLSIPVIVAIRRPKKLIGFSGDIEFINFHLKVPNEKITDTGIADDCAVSFKRHEQPLTLIKAQEISGHTSVIQGVSLVAGCGALGSRILLHFAKSGYTNYIVADNDKLMPHNFVRHPLSAQYLNQNKALALKKEIDLIYKGTQIPGADGTVGLNINADLLVNLASEKPLFKRILDFTASPIFEQKLVQANLTETTEVYKAYLTDKGQLGILLKEGTNRNPRIDDLQALLYNEAIRNTSIAAWLKREADSSASIRNFIVGVGCNSETTVLSDEEIACHSAILSGILRQELTSEISGAGNVYSNQLSHKPFFTSETALFTFQKLECFRAVNNEMWQLRFANGLIESMKKQMLAAMPKETGGVFVGSCNYKTHTIHITTLIDAPPDSKANNVCFFRGIKGLANKIEEINDATGGQMGYIGEWHSHPNGPEHLSETDMGTINRFKAEYEQNSPSIPVFITIVTSTNILPFVY